MWIVFGSSKQIWLSHIVSPSEMNTVDSSWHEMLSAPHQWIYSWDALREAERLESPPADKKKR